MSWSTTLSSVNSYLSRFWENIPMPSLSFLSNTDELPPSTLSISTLPIFSSQNENDLRDHLGRFLRALSSEPLDESAFIFFSRYLKWTYPDAKIDFLSPKENCSPGTAISEFLLQRKDQLDKLIESYALIYPYLQGQNRVALIVLFSGKVYYLDPLGATLPGEVLLSKLERINEDISGSYDGEESKSSSIDLNPISREEDSYITVSSLKKVVTKKLSSQADRTHSPLYALFILEEIYRGTPADQISFQDFDALAYKETLYKKLEPLKHKILNRSAFERVVITWGDSLVWQRNQKSRDFLESEARLVRELENAKTEHVKSENDYRKALHQVDEESAKRNFEEACKTRSRLFKELEEHRQKHIDEVFQFSLEVKRAREKILACAWDGSPCLDLKNCSLSTLPGCLRQLTELKQLDVSGNPLSPIALQTLEQLKTDLSHLEVVLNM